MIYHFMSKTILMLDWSSWVLINCHTNYKVQSKLIIPTDINNKYNLIKLQLILKRLFQMFNNRVGFLWVYIVLIKYFMYENI